MKDLSSSPASMSVVYTIEHVSTVPLRHWHAFVLAVQKPSGNCRCVCVREICICRRLTARLTCFRLLMSWRSVAIQAAVSDRST